MPERAAIVTGASRGIGFALAEVLGEEGHALTISARKPDTLEEAAARLSDRGFDVQPVLANLAQEEGVREVVERHRERYGRLDVLVNNAGGAYGSDRVDGADLDDWSQMFEVNVLGVVRVTKALLPALRATGHGLIVNIGSTAGRVAYAGGGGYTAAKHGLHALSQTLRLELNGEPVRVTEIAPGMVHTAEFALVRFGDQERADAVYADVDRPLVAADVAEAVRWVASLPEHMNVDELVLRPVAQAAQHQLHRGPIFNS